MDRLKAFRRGVLAGDKRSVASPTRSQSWQLDALGNWPSNTLDGNTQTRKHNPANEITDLSGTTSDPTYDPCGNMTADDRFFYAYDAWNQLAEARNRDANTLVATYRYDAYGRRISKTVSGQPNVRYDYFYDNRWRLIEVRKDGNTHSYERYVWSDRYIDAPVCRMRDEDCDGQNVETLYYLTDAQMNVTALIDPSSGLPVERYSYDAYGVPTIYDANGTQIAWANSRKNEILFCGYRYDPETGNYCVRHRIYLPHLGVWGQAPNGTKLGHGNSP